MFCRRVVIDMPKKDEVYKLTPIGDVHVGSPNFNQDRFERKINEIASDPKHLTIGMGDYIDNIMAFRNGMLDKRWNAHAQGRKYLTTLEQVVYFTHKWKKVADKSLGMLAGNHEWATIDQQQFLMYFCNPLDWEVNEMDTGVQQLALKGTTVGQALYREHYLGRLAFVNLSFQYKKKSVHDYLMVVMHGGYSGRKTGGAVNRLTDLTASYQGDVFLMGHSHDSVLQVISRLNYDKKHNDNYIQKILLGNTGTFLESYSKGVDSYVENNPSAAKRVATITVNFNPAEGDIGGEI